MLALLKSATKSLLLSLLILPFWDDGAPLDGPFKLFCWLKKLLLVSDDAEKPLWCKWWARLWWWRLLAVGGVSWMDFRTAKLLSACWWITLETPLVWGNGCWCNCCDAFMDFNGLAGSRKYLKLRECNGIIFRILYFLTVFFHISQSWILGDPVSLFVLNPKGRAMFWSIHHFHAYVEIRARRE